MTCEHCSSTHYGEYGSGRFCSTKCARGFSGRCGRGRVIRNGRPKPQIQYCKSCGTRIGCYNRSILCGKCLHSTIEFRMKVSDGCRRSGKVGGYRPSSGRGKKCWYFSPIAGKVYLQSSYELAYAKYLDSIRADWSRNTTRFQYMYNGQSHYYIPDFKIGQNSYIEIKGFSQPVDFEKWKVVPNLTVLYGRDLKKLGLFV